MDQTSFEKYVNERYSEQISWYHDKSSQNQATYRVLQWALIVLSASTPVIVALSQKTNPPIYLGSLSLLTSVLVAILATGLKAFKFEENWINYRTTCESLKRELYFYEAKTNDYRSSDDREALFVERVEALLSRENTLWLTTVKDKQDGKPTS
jgi:hypothetical protein